MRQTREPWVDLLKVLAAQAIVWHHLSAYGPLGDALYDHHPAASALLYDEARKAVQVFLVAGGFLAARTLDQPLDGRAWWRTVRDRYLRLVPPFLAALALATAVALALQAWLTDDLRAPAPDVRTWLAHVLLLHDVVDVPALAVGAWYVAIDWQLHALLAALAWAATTRLAPPPWRPHAARALLLGLILLSLLHVNRRPDLDPWAVYFAGSYGLGVLAAQAARGQRTPWALLIVLLGAAALAVEWRDRIALSSAVALALALLAGRWPWPRAGHWLAAAADRSYALFLTHYTVVLLANAALARWPGWTSHAWALATGAWLASLLLAWGFERAVERPLARAVRPRRT